jgi:spore germination protein GerM
MMLMLLASCGLPGQGSVRTVDDESVPSGLLESAAPSSDATGPAPVPGRVPVVYWLVDEDRLTPAASEASCAEAPQAVVTRLLEELTIGPTDEARAAGRSTAIPPESAPILVDISAGTARVEVGSETSISADRLPAAVGQIVLTVTSAPGVDSAELVSDGASVQLPLPGGALIEGPVTADDYATLVPARYQADDVGCPHS